MEKILELMRRAPNNCRYVDVYKVCVYYFGKPRQDGTSHAVFKMPWKYDPRVNIQRGSDGLAKSYQVKDVLKAIAKLQSMEEEG